MRGVLREAELATKADQVAKLSGKLTQANVELQTLRSQLDTRTRDLAYTRRLLERSRQQQAMLQVRRLVTFACDGRVAETCG